MSKVKAPYWIPWALLVFGLLNLWLDYKWAVAAVLATACYCIKESIDTIEEISNDRH